MYEELTIKLRNCSSSAAPCRTCDMMENNRCTDDLMRQAADVIELLESRLRNHEQRWISLKDIFPNDEEDVLLKFPHNRAVGFWDKGAWGVCSGDGFYTEVAENEAKPTHWMPLPDPPNEVDQEERNRELCRSNYAAQLEGLGYNADGTPKCSE